MIRPQAFTSASAVARQRGSVRLALLCALAGAAVVVIWSMQQPREAGPTSPERGTAVAATAPGAAASETQGVEAAAVSQPGPPLPAPPDAAARGPAQQDEFDAAQAATADADGFSPDYGALVDEFQQQRLLDPLVDD